MLFDLSTLRSRPDHQATAQAFYRVVQVIAEEEGLRPSDLMARTRGLAPIAAARQTAMYLCHVAVGRSLTDVGRFFGRDRTTVAHACRMIEDRRDDTAVDLRLEALERKCLGGDETRIGE